MAKLSSQINVQYLDIQDVGSIYEIRSNSLRLFYSSSNPNLNIHFAGYTTDEISDELIYQLSEIEKDSCLSLLAAIEALFRLDYAIRCEEKDKESISRKFREWFAEHEYRISLEEGIFDEWRNAGLVKNSIISNLKGVFKYRHWLAHGRYWTLKAGKLKYDFYELFTLALEVEKLPLKKMR